MAMKLLPKSEVAISKAVERKREIDEGLKLAKQVDNLREVRATEEVVFAKFRQETLTNLNEEITQKTQERDGLVKEVSDLRIEREGLQKPLDEEWDRVNAYAAELNLRGESLDAAETANRARERDTELALENARSAEARALLREQSSKESYDTAAADKESAKGVLVKAQKVKEEAESLKSKTNRELMHRDIIASGREREVTLKQAELTRGQKELENGWLLLKDREAMFERTLKRNK